MIERIHLTLLREIDRKGSLTAAAEAMHLTQSALSHAIKKLEQQAGVALWLKEGRNLRLTQAGEYLLQAANRLLPQLERTDAKLVEYAKGEAGSIRIGMECHPCYQWLLRVVEPFLMAWPGVDVDVKQRFKFGGMAALFSHDIDILVTPDPLHKPGIEFVPVFAYEQVLVVQRGHPLAVKGFVIPADLAEEVLYTYPVDIERLDIYNEFFTPANSRPKKRTVIESPEIMLQLVMAGRGVATLPKWLVAEVAKTKNITSVRLGKKGIHKNIYLGVRQSDKDLPHLSAFMALARDMGVKSL